MTALDLTPFFNDRWWVVLIKALFAFVLLMVLTLFTIVYERKVVGLMQHRKGPTMNGPFGSLQSLADGMKLMFKEDFTPKAAERVVFTLAPFVSAIPAVVAISVIPISGDRPRPLHEHHHPAPGDRPAGLGAVHRGARLDRRVRDRPRRLVVGLDVRPARRPALERPGDQLRGRDGPGAGRGLPLRRVAVHLGDRRGAGGAAGLDPRSPVPDLVLPAAVAVVRHLPDLDGGGDQPRAVRPARGRGRAGRRLPHRVLLDALRHVLHGRVHEHDHGLGPGHDPVPGRLARDLPVQPDPGRGRRLPRHHLVPDQDAGPAVRLRLAPRHAAPAALRPVHAVRLEVAHPDLAGLDRAHRGPPA